MRVVSVGQFGPVADLTVSDAPSPAIRPGWVRVSVKAVGLNFVDGLLVQGLYQIKPPLPFVPGTDLAGVVSELGEGVTQWVVGDRVCISSIIGAMAEEVVLPAFVLVRSPERLDDAGAATFLQSYATAWFALRRRAAARRGQKLLVLGAGGGVGLAAVDVARSMGLRVIAAASSAEKRALAMEYGAEAAIDTATADLKARTRELSDGGVDLVYDPIGGASTEQAVRALAPEGRLLMVGFAAGDIPRLALNLVLLTNRSVVGVDWGAWSTRHPLDNLAMLNDISAAVDRGELRPVAPARYDFADVGRALTDQVERRVVGKAVLML